MELVILIDFHIFFNLFFSLLATPYDELNHRVSDLLDKSVNNDVSRSLLKDDPLETKTDIILNKICEGIVGLLRKWPDQKYKLHAFLNQPLPQPIRFVGWHLYLSNNNRLSSSLSQIFFTRFLIEFRSTKISQ